MMARFAVEAPVTMLRGEPDMAGSVSDDELPLRCREVAVGHVDCDSLLSLGPQAVGEEGEVDVFVTALF